MNPWDEWIGRSRNSQGQLDHWPSQALSASLELAPPSPTEGLPLLWQWIYFLESPDRRRQGDDGHPQKGDFLPPVSNPRRMFVGARSTVHRPLQLGHRAQLRETIQSCEEKTGGSGAMTLLTVRYQYLQEDHLCIEEERDFMYLPARAGQQPEQRCADYSELAASDWSRDVPTDSVLLFKFSALTFNGHRIHYDRDYARKAESYPDLVVHGPMTALLLADLARRVSGKGLQGFNFRARAPLYVGDVLRLRGEPATDAGLVKLVAYRPDGKAAMTAEAQLT
jgi:3-methylfumaryl-CoA hydratase